MNPALRLARFHAARIPAPGHYAAMIAALYAMLGPKRDGTMPFRLR